MTPETVTVEPFTAVTLPVATVSDAKALRKLLEPEPPEGKLGRVPLPVRSAEPGSAAGAAAEETTAATGCATGRRAYRKPLVHEPLELGVVKLMLRAAMVVLEDFEAVPVTDTQSPAARELTASDAVLENCVVDVQLTVVWPELAFCTSMLEVLSAATLPSRRSVRPTSWLHRRRWRWPRRRRARWTQRPGIGPSAGRFVLRLVGVCMSVVPLSLSVSFVC